MNLYVIRHASATPVGAPGVQGDEERPLNEAGMKQMIQLLNTFQRLRIQFDLIFTSPLVRARQTAEGIMRGLGLPDDRLQITDRLAPGGSGKKLARLLRKAEGEHVAIVGHEPDLSRLTAWLIGSKRAQLNLSKAGVACLHCDAPLDKGAASLEWLVTPSWLDPAQVREWPDGSATSHRG